VSGAFSPRRKASRCRSDTGTPFVPSNPAPDAGIPLVAAAAAAVAACLGLSSALVMTGEEFRLASWGTGEERLLKLL